MAIRRRRRRRRRSRSRRFRRVILTVFPRDRYRVSRRIRIHAPMFLFHQSRHAVSIFLDHGADFRRARR